MDVKITLLKHGPKVLPEYATEGSAGIDIGAAIQKPIHIGPGERILIPSGFKLEVPIKYLYYKDTFTPYSILDKEDDTIDAMLPSQVPDKDLREKVTDELIKKVKEILETNVIEISKKIYNTKHILSFQLKEKIINE